MSRNSINTSIVDFHVHAFPDSVAPRAADALFAEHHLKPLTDVTISGTLAHMRRAGISHCVIMPVATKPTQVQSINNWAASHSTPGIISFGGIHPDYEDISGEIERIIELGLPGIKIQANWQDVYLDDPRMYPIYEAMQGRLILLLHCGAEATACDKMYATPRLVAKIHSQFSNLTIIAAHMGGYIMWDEAEEYLIGKDIYMDTSACFPDKLPDDRMLRMMRDHGTDRILFATDLPFGTPLRDVPRFVQMGLTDSELEAIFYENAHRLLGRRVE